MKYEQSNTTEILENPSLFQSDFWPLYLRLQFNLLCLFISHLNSLEALLQVMTPPPLHFLEKSFRESEP